MKQENSYAMDHQCLDHSPYSFFPWFYQSSFSFRFVYSDMTAAVVVVIVVAYVHSVITSHFLRHNISKCKPILIAKISFRKQKLFHFRWFTFFALPLALCKLFLYRFTKKSNQQKTAERERQKNIALKLLETRKMFI